MTDNITTDNMSNEEVIEVLKGIVFNGFDRTTSEERQALHLAIKALEERPQGEWTNISPYDDKGECSLCCYLSKKYYKFCPNCGADMQKGDAV